MSGSLPDVPGGWSERTVRIASHRFEMLAPADPDELLGQLEECSAPHLADPYWSAIWSASPAMAQQVARQPWPPGTFALELGCGVGLAGMAALAAGVAVTFSDYIELAVATALGNARRNGFSSATGFCLDWRDPPDLQPFPLVLASDVLYETSLHADLLTTLDRVLSDDGQCWIGDPCRAAADDFTALARQRGYRVTIDRDEAATSAPAAAPFQRFILRRG